ncbi:hypothetical protein NUW58_g4207 [Xylaria curta]|uniref:Uncharacterized protein n=1 Tax=Xylaria curta TaxID=42375 RepID=A0ACC1P7I2_9PEZI|nr:hypothetical protein NUW58_g4207 [Xylaria curta]
MTTYSYVCARTITAPFSVAFSDFTCDIELRNAALGASRHVIGLPAARDGAQSPLRIDRLFYQAIPRGDIDIYTNVDAEALRYKSVWKPGVLHNVPKSTIESMRNVLTDEEISFEKKLIRASCYFLVNAINAKLRKMATGAGKRREDWSLSG